MSAPLAPAVVKPSLLTGRRVLILNWRDTRHPQAGGAEWYVHEIARRWVRQGVDVTWFTARVAGLPAKESVEGIHMIRYGGPLSLYPRAAAWLMSTARKFDAVVDCQNGIPFFSPMFTGAEVPVVQVVHHVHQDQFATRFSPPVAALGRFLEGPLSRRVYRSRVVAAVSPSTRSELRGRLGYRGPIHIVPNGTVDIVDDTVPRAAEPTIVLVSRLVAHKRIDLLLGQVVVAARAVPRLRVEIIGDGPERAHLESLVSDLGLRRIVTLHGFLDDGERDRLLRRAWLTTSTSAAEGWGNAVIEAAAWGVPCVALRVPGICDSVLHERTGWLVDRPEQVGHALVAALHALADDTVAAETAAACREWARCFSWDRSADLLAGVLFDQMTASARGVRTDQLRLARSDLASLAHFHLPDQADLRSVLRATDEIADDGDRISILLTGCDEFDAVGVLRRIGVVDAAVRLVDRQGLLAGPSFALLGAGGAVGLNPG